jgi:hypothetical protein
VARPRGAADSGTGSKDSIHPGAGRRHTGCAGVQVQVQVQVQGRVQVRARVDVQADRQSDK